MTRIVLLKLYNNDMVIGEVDNENALTDEIFLSNPRMIVIAPTMTGDARVMMTSVCAPFRVERLKKEIGIKTNQVMFELNEDEIDNELINGYKSDVSGIKIATASDMTAINSEKIQGGSFIL